MGQGGRPPGICRDNDWILFVMPNPVSEFGVRFTKRHEYFVAQPFGADISFLAFAFLPAHQIKRHHACIYAVQYLFYIVPGGELRFPNLYLRGNLDGQIVSALEVFADQV